jgi:hypothetical protein
MPASTYKPDTITRVKAQVLARLHTKGPQCVSELAKGDFASDPLLRRVLLDLVTEGTVRSEIVTRHAPGNGRGYAGQDYQTRVYSLARGRDR